MVCKRSLYCWKNGPCASDQTRKQIWEDNIRFRESLRSMNQSDHYWSFQVSNNRNCRCVEEDFNRQRSALTRSYRGGSLQRLDRTDCSSITHPSDYSVQKINNNLEPRFKSSQVLCPLHLCPDAQSTVGADIPTDYDNLYEKKSILKKEVPKIPLLPCNLNGSLNRAHKVKLTEDLPKYCPRYKNTLTATPLKCNYKIKYSSQPSLLSGKKSNLDVKKHFTSNEEVQHDDEKENNIELAKNQHHQPKIKNLSPISPEKKTKILNDLKPPETAGSKKPKMLTRETYTPISRTTRRMLNEERKVPFVTFGCNNDNKDVGSKRTHNVLASQQEVFPSALSAKVNRQSMMMKYLKTEKEFQRNLLPDDFRKKFVNHSSVWATEYNQKNKDLASSKNYKKIPPLNDKRMKSQSLVNESNKQLPLGKSLRRPSSQAYFY